MKTSISHRLPDVVAQVGQVPSMAREAARSAINATLPKGSDAVYQAMRRVFDRPTPWALDSLRVEQVGDAGPIEGAVMIKGNQDVRGTGIPGQSFLRAEIEGGARRWKRSERAMHKSGILPQGWYAIPGSAARMDQYGNMTRGHVLEVLDYIRAIKADGRKRRSAITDKGRAQRKRGRGKRLGFEYFVIRPGDRGGLRPGVWLRQIATRKAIGAPAPLRQVLTFVKSVHYRARLDFYGEAARAVAQELPPQMDRAIARVRALRPLRDVR